MWFRRTDRDFADEITAHIQLEMDRLIAQGMNPADARDAATRTFGNTTRAKERFHERHGVLVEQVMQDLRYAVRALRRTPAFAIVAVLCLTVGISVNTAAFSFLNAVAFRDFPGVVRQDELVTLRMGQETPRGRSSGENMSLPDFEAVRAGVPAFTAVAAFHNLQLSVRTTGEPKAIRGDLVSDNFFSVLGTEPALGRFMIPSDLDRAAVISHRYWQHTFDARPDVLGQVVTVGTRAFTVIGVAPEGFFGLYPGEVIDPDVGAPEVFIPLAAAGYVRATITTGPKAIADRWLQVFGRVRPGATLPQVQAQVDAVARGLARSYPVERKNAFVELSAGGDRSKDAAELISAILLVMAVPIILLLVACANLANQLLARAIQRAREIAVRLSLGATRARVVRQLLVETALLAVVASALGVLVARWLLDGLRAWFLPLPFRIPIDLRVMAFTVGLALFTALAFGLTPALRATRTDLISTLKDGAPGSGYRRSRLRSALVMAQIALSLALITLSSVFVASARRPPSALDALGNRSLLVAVNLDLLGFDSTTGRAYQVAALERLSRVPGVESVGMAPWAMFDQLQGSRVTEPDSKARPQYVDVGPVAGAWFDATNTKAIRGRLFTAAEQVAHSGVAIVDQAFVQRYLSDSQAVGRTLSIGDDSIASAVTIVGVIPTRQEVAFRQAEGVVIMPLRQYQPRTFFYLRTSRDADAMIDAVGQSMRALDPRVPILWVRTMEDVAAHETAPLAMVATGMVSLGSVGMALASLGLFGVLSFIVAQRRYEIGIRVALGARSIDVTWLVLNQALRLGAGGVVVGAGLALGTVVVLRAIIYGLPNLDPVMFLSISGIMVAVALLASVIPAWRATAVDPMQALRTE